MSRLCLILSIICIFMLLNIKSNAQDCSGCGSVVTVDVDLSANPDTTWISPEILRSGQCCGATGSLVCIRFNVTTHPDANQFEFTLASPPIPPSMQYQLNCGPPQSVDDPLCITGTGPHCIVYCKSGGDKSSYKIITAKAVDASPDITLSDGCTGQIYATGLDEATVTWNVITPDASYNSYLDCLSGCDTVNVTPQVGYPPFIEVEVSGSMATTCAAFTITDTVQVNFVSDKAVAISPANPAICFGGTAATLTANPTGGAPPYTYTWNTAETTQSISAGTVGQYVVEMYDATTCPPVYDTVNLIAHPSLITVNAGTDLISCVSSPAVTLSGVVGVATGGIWSGGTGAFTPDATDLNATYTPSATEITAGTVTLTLTSTGNGGCAAVTDDVVITITPSPTVEAGASQSVCGNNSAVSLAGTVTNATGGTWSGGGGSFTPSATDLNATYQPTAGEITAGTVTLTLTSTGGCASVSDNMVVTITPSPTASAGADQTVCGNNSAVSLSGSVTVATGGTWSGGAGTYSPDANTLNATYTPSAGEITAGTVTLTLTTTGNGTCNAVSDDMVVTITPSPTASAGADQTVCGNNSAVSLNGSVTIATGGTWSGGAGTFTPDANTLNATYQPTAGEITAGTVTLTLTTTGNGTCNAVSDDMVVTITPSPTASAGADQTVCGNNSAVSLNGSVTVASGGTWSGGTGSFSPDANTLNATYTPSAGEITAGTVTLTLTTIGNGTCNAVSDDMVVTITPSPTASAGADQTVCGNNSGVPLNGSVTVASGGTWSGGAGTYSPDANTLNATYQPTAGEISAGTVTLTLTTTGNGTCTAVSDDMVVTITVSPTASPGADQTVCGNNSAVSLNGSVTVATGGTWSGGTGSFSPSASDLNATYTPSAGEITAGTVTLTLTTTGNGTCTAVSDNMVVTITPSPTASAGADQTVCGNNSAVSLNGSVTVATGGTWSGGAGTFTPDANTLNAIYQPTAAEITAGTVTLTLTTTGNGTCTAVSDDMVVTITASPTASAGADQTVCGNNSAVSLNGSVTVASGGLWTGGSGSYTPSASDLNATYTPSAGEITAGTVTLTLTTTGNGTCTAVSDNMVVTITPSPTASAGADQTVCGNNSGVPLNGSVTVASGGTWSGGSGSYSPSASDLNATYQPTVAEITAGTVTLTLTTTGNGTCNAVSDNVVITITPSPTVEAGASHTVCGNNSAVSLSGSVTVASGGLWSGGSGSYSPSASDLNATYQPTAAEITAGMVTLTLTTTGNGTCNAVSDNMVVTITPSPTAATGASQTVCSNNSAVSLSGSVTVASGGLWSGGSGTFSPSASDLNTTYQPSAGEIAAGSASLTLTTTGNGNCLSVNDNIVISITPAPVASAGSDLAVCGNNSGATLNGSVNIATGGLWSGGSGTYSPSATDLNATYEPSATEITNGTATLTLTTTGNGNCLSVSDDVLLTITPSPTVDAGTDKTVCGNNANVSLNGLVTIATGGLWSGGTGTFSPTPSTLNAVYTPSAAEISAGTVTLTLTTTGNGSCTPVSDDITITITPAPVVDAGLDDAVCANNTSVNLSGSVTVASGAVWTGGTGSFVPSASDLNATYSPSAAEIANGNVTLTLISTGNGNCVAVQDDKIITINPGPTANAGASQTICANNPDVQLAGSVTVATGGKWSGAGTFSATDSDLNAVYTPTDAELSAGTFTLTLTTTGNGSCLAETDQMSVSVIPAPLVIAGGDQNICVTENEVTLNGAVIGITSTGQWSTTGNGTFDPDATTLNTKYIPTADDLSAGSIGITLTSTNNGSCNPVSDNATIFFNPKPTASAGADQSVCANNALVQLGGAVTVATGGLWTTSGSGTFTPSATDLNATYTPSAADITDGVIIISLTTTGNGICPAVTDFMTIIILPAPVVDAGADDQICSNNAEIQLTANITGVTTSGEWTSSGTGSFLANNTVVNGQYVASAADTANGSVTLTLISTNNKNCNAVTDQVTYTFTPSPVVDAGADEVICANNPLINLNGSVTNATDGEWTTNGSGTFAGTLSAAGTSYTASVADTVNGSVVLTLTSIGNGNCSAVSDQKVVTIGSSPVVDAGNTLVLCDNETSIQLAGTVTGGANAGIWSTGGSGSFTPNANTLLGEYVPSANDMLQDTILLTLTSDQNGTCLPVSDEVKLAITKSPLVSAGADQVVCANNPIIPLNGSVENVPYGRWTTSGSGEFSPADTLTSLLYTPSNADTANGSVVISYSASNACASVSESVTVTFTPAPFVSAGADQAICVDGYAELNGTVTGGAITGMWTSSGSGFFTPDNNSLVATYFPSPADTVAGAVTLSLMSTNNGNCMPVTDELELTFLGKPIVNIQSPVSICAGADITLEAIITGGSGQGIWTSSNGSGTFAPGNLSSNVVYTPDQTDIDRGEVTFIYTTLNNGTCQPGSNAVTVEILPPPGIYAGPDQNICANVSDIQLAGTLDEDLQTSYWTTTGSGSFVPDSSYADARYIISTNDITAGSISFSLHSEDGCSGVMDEMTVQFTPAPLVNAGEDIYLCFGDTQADLFGTVMGGASSGGWSTMGTGAFSLSTDALENTYTLSADDSNNGRVGLILTSTANGGCLPESDTVVVALTTVPTVNAGSDQSFCTNETASLAGVVTGGSGSGVWSTSGDGYFTPSDTVLLATYVPGDQDKVNKSVTLTLSASRACVINTDEVKLTLIDGPEVSVGVDQYICETENSVSVSGTVTTWAQPGLWTTTGSGSFSPNTNSLSVNYSPSATDKSNGGVHLILQSTNNGGCSVSRDTVFIDIVKTPTVNAGSDLTACTNGTVVLNGSIFGGSGSGQWSSTDATGVFTYTDSLSTEYTLGVNDSINGLATLTLTTSGDSVCTGANDNLQVTVINAPVVDAGLDDTVCANNATVQLNGSVSGATGGKWSGAGTFSAADTDLNALYEPAEAELLAGVFTLSLTSTGNGGCQAMTDSKTVTVTQAPVVNAGPDRYICYGSTSVGLFGSVSGITATGKWSTLGSGTFFPHDSASSVVYNLSDADTSAGFVDLLLTSTNNGECNSVSDTIRVFLTDVPKVSAGADQTVCANNAEVQLDGSMINGTGSVQWTKLSGSGTFSNDTLLAPVYTPNDIDIASGSVSLILSVNDVCVPHRDTMVITITPSPIVDAGEDRIVCNNASAITLTGSVTEGSIQGLWSSLGSGTFGNASLLNTNYTPSTADTSSGSVILVLESTNNGLCRTEKDRITITFGTRPVAGMDFITPICQGESVQFTDQSTVSWGTITEYAWDFSNGQTSTSEDVGQRFNLPGIYYITHSVKSDKGCEDTIVSTLTVRQGPEAIFDATPNCLQDPIEFFNTSKRAVIWQWFVDGVQISTDENPVPYPVDSLRVYELGLITTDVNGCTDTASKTIQIKPSPEAEFVVGNICVGDVAEFIDYSKVEDDTLRTWQWDLGDGSTSTEREPSHRYVTDDSVYIKLVVATATCTDTLTRLLVPMPSPTFQPDPFEGCSPLEVNFNNDTVAGARYFWDFGDNGSSTAQFPNHVFFNSSGKDTTFNVRLRVESAFGCTDSTSQPILVHSSTESKFSFEPATICSDETVQMTDESENAVSYEWIYPDLSPTDKTKDAEHEFYNPTTSTQFFPIHHVIHSASGCTDTAIQFVTVNPIPDFSIEQDVDSTCHPAVVNFSSFPGALIYSWDYGDGSFEDASYDVLHTYVNYSQVDSVYDIRLITTSLKGCKDTTFTTLTVHPSPVALFDVDTVIGCPPLKINIENQSQSAVSYDWDYGDGTVDAESGLTFSHLFDNDKQTQVGYKINLTATSANGCMAQHSHTVNVFPGLNADFAVDSVGCTPLTLNFANNSEYADSYIWNFGDDGFSTNLNPAHTFINSGFVDVTYNAYLVGISPFGCRDTSRVVPILVHPKPHGAFDVNTTSACTPFELIISNQTQGATGINWEFGDTAILESLDRRIKHTYRNYTDEVMSYELLQINTNDHGCVDTVLQSITAYPAVEALFSVDSAGCSPLKATFKNNSQGAVSYSWQMGDGNVSAATIPQHTFANLGFHNIDYTVSLVTESNFGCSDTAYQTVSVRPRPSARFGVLENAGCAPLVAQLIDSTSGVTTYHWDYGNGEMISTQSFVSRYTYENTSNGVLKNNLILIAENDYGCTDTVDETITIYPQVNASFEHNEPGCSPLTVQFDNLSDDVLTYVWNFDDGGTSGLKNPSHTFQNNSDTDRNFNVSLTITSNFNCSATANSQVTVYATPEAEYDVDPSFQYYPEATVTIDNKTKGTNWDFEWDWDDGTTSTQINPGTYTYNDWGQYFILLRVSSDNCWDTISHVVTISPGAPVADYDSAFIGCAPLTVTFVNNSQNATWYKWKFGDGGSSDDEVPTYTYYIPGNYVVELSVGNISGTDVNRKHTITVQSKPEVFFQVAPNVVYLPDGIMSCYNLTDNGYTYIWDFGDGNTSTEVEPQHYYEKTGVYDITLYAESEGGCADSYTKENAVEVSVSCDIIFPSAFTPIPDASGDGKYDPEEIESRNDIFHPLSKNIVEHNIKIYNRWGEMVFESNEVDVGWNGFYKGALAKQDVYIWKAKAKCIEGKVISKTGSVTLLR